MNGLSVPTEDLLLLPGRGQGLRVRKPRSLWHDWRRQPTAMMLALLAAACMLVLLAGNSLSQAAAPTSTSAVDATAATAAAAATAASAAADVPQASLDLSSPSFAASAATGSAVEGSFEVESAAVVETSLEAHHTGSYITDARTTAAQDEAVRLPPLTVLRRGETFQVQVLVKVKGAEHRLAAADFALLATMVGVPGAKPEVLPLGLQAVSPTPQQQGVLYTLQASPAASFPVGRYSLAVRVGGQLVAIEQDAAILFNPYSAVDPSVYLDDKAMIAEHIENEYGNVFRGTIIDTDSTLWYYGQFEPAVLHTALEFVSRFVANGGDSRDVVLLSRYLTYILNADPDTQGEKKPGMLVGNWSGNYTGGELPDSWQSSAELYRQFIQTRGQFAQCWVFAACLNSALRSLGIPSLQLSNFNSAHEELRHGYTHTVEEFYDTSGKLLHTEGHVWNFHSWNQAWMCRNDLSKGSPGSGCGWQVLDATPQEKSEGLWQTGPAPLAAVLAEGRADSTMYDTPFVVSEVASVVRRFIGNCTERVPGKPQTCTPVRKLGEDDPTIVAGKILTSSYDLAAPGQLDITSWYHDTALHSKKPVEKDPSAALSVVVKAQKTVIGQPIVLSVHMAMDPAKAATACVQVPYSLHGSYQHYKGNLLKHVLAVTASAELCKDMQYQTTVEYTLEDYFDAKVGSNNLRFDVVAGAADAAVEPQADSTLLRLSTPPVLMEADTTMHLSPHTQRRVYPLRVTFANPLPVALTHCSFRVHGVELGLETEVAVASLPAAPKAPSDFMVRMTMDRADDDFRSYFYSPAAGDSVGLSLELDLAPEAPGKHFVLGLLRCDQLTAQGQLQVEVQLAPGTLAQRNSNLQALLLRDGTPAAAVRSVLVPSAPQTAQSVEDPSVITHVFVVGDTQAHGKHKMRKEKDAWLYGVEQATEHVNGLRATGSSGDVVHGHVRSYDRAEIEAELKGMDKDMGQAQRFVGSAVLADGGTTRAWWYGTAP